MIPVTKTFIPPIEEYNLFLNRCFSNNWLTNRGELVLELESKLKDKLKMDHLLIVNNGTIPLQIALKLLGKQGEIITTPFSYVATTAAIVWENCTPVFVDIHPDYLTIDESKIEAGITDKTTCILATHVYGNPCNVEEIERIAKKHNLQVIYDAAHCFGVEYKGQSVFNYGTLSTCSFHATKLFHTGEGGAIFCSDNELAHKIYYSHNFGHKTPSEFFDVGINGKISELQAAMGLTVLPYIDQIIRSRKQICELYTESLRNTEVKLLQIREHTNWNYSYFPVIFNSETKLLKTMEVLAKENIHPRRYFYPSLNTLGYVTSKDLKVSEDIAPRILCLPLFHDLSHEDVGRICELIKSTLS